MRILYLSCHAILEFDELSLFNRIGHYAFSPGAYVCPLNPGDNSLRPGLIDIKYDEEDLAAWHSLASKYPGKDTKDYLTKEFVNRFDVVVVMHLPRWIQRNWHVFEDRPVVWRTIGQSIKNTEDSLRQYRERGMKIVRYSPKEFNIPGYLGGDALIRFYKNPEEYKGWVGHDLKVVTLAQSMRKRGTHCNYQLFERVTRNFSRKLYGPGNEDTGILDGGKLSFKDMKAMLRNNRVYFYTGTHPASYTLNFIESWMTGIPIVAIGPKNGNSPNYHNHELFEVADLIHHGVNGFVSDDEQELKLCIQELLDNPILAKQISDAGRASAIATFGKEKIETQWTEFLQTL